MAVKKKLPAAKETQVQAILAGLKRDYPDVECALEHKNPLQLLIATILSAQCTDERVNQVTKVLFKKYPTAKAYAESKSEELEAIIRSTGFFRAKAANIRACCRDLCEKHAGDVPRDLKSLVNLAGVGRKTANVVLGTAFGIPSGVVVDTHVQRLSQRLGLTKNKDPKKIEMDLMAILPDCEWIDFSHRLIWHGRKVCQARKPKCDDCGLVEFCPRKGVASKA